MTTKTTIGTRDWTPPKPLPPSPAPGAPNSVEILAAALRAMLEAHPLPDDLRRVPDKVCAAHDQADSALLLAPVPFIPAMVSRGRARLSGWRQTQAGAWVLSNAVGAEIGNAYRVPSGEWCGDPWGRERRHFNGPSAEQDAKAWVNAAFRR